MTLKSLSKCIYCGDSDVPLSDEHVIPYSLGGTWILPKASCAACAAITSKLERHVSRDMYLRLRTKAKFPTYRPRKRPQSFDVVFVSKDGTRRTATVPISKYPTIYPVLHLPPPGMLVGELPSDRNPEMRVSLVGSQAEMDALGEEHPDTSGIEVSFEFRWGDLCRSLAKIAHSFTVGKLGAVGYTPFLPQLILGGYPYLAHLVGGATETKAPRVARSGDGIAVAVDHDGRIVVSIDILGGRLPTYAVVAGLVTDWNAFLTNVAFVSREDKPEYAHGMRTRFGFTHEWARAIVEGIRAFVRRDFLALEPSWPLLSGYAFDAYALPPSHYLLILRTTVDTTPAGPDGALLPSALDHPVIPPRADDLDAWSTWVHSRLGFPADAWPIVLPVHDAGKHMKTDADYELFSDADREFWDAQFNFTFQRQLRCALESRAA